MKKVFVDPIVTTIIFDDKDIITGSPLPGEPNIFVLPNDDSENVG